MTRTPYLHAGPTRTSSSPREGWGRRALRRVFGGALREMVMQDVTDITQSLQMDYLEKVSRGAASAETWTFDRWERLRRIRRMYAGEAQHGSIPCQAVVNFNRSFQMASGLVVLAEDREAAAEEMSIVQDFLDFNDLTEERLLDLGAENELSGQVLFRFAWDEAARHVLLWPVSLLETRYRVEYADALTLKHAVLYPDSEQQTTVPAEELVYIKFRAHWNAPHGTPTPMGCVAQMENVSKALEDLRRINHLFAHPTPVLNVLDDRIQAVETQIANTNWKIGQSLVLGADESYKLAELGGTGAEYLLKEIQVLMQQISALTDVPVHFLGYPELLSNRSTSEDLFEGPVKRAQADQRVWIGGFEELLAKVLPLYSAGLGRTLDPEAVAIAFPPIRQGNMADVLQAWTAVRSARNISLRTYLEKIGIADPDEEIRLMQEESTQRQQEQADAARAAAEDFDRDLELITRQVEQEAS